MRYYFVLYSLFLLNIVTYSQQLDYDKEQDSYLNGLHKTTIFNQNIYNYVNSSFNISYTCPSGWSIYSIDTLGGVMLFITVKKLNRDDVIIMCIRQDLGGQMANNPHYLFRIIFGCYQESGNYMPGIAGIADSMYFKTGETSAYKRLSYVNIKYKMNTNLQYINQKIAWAQSTDKEFHEIVIQTTVSSYSDYLNEYNEHWKNLEFLSTSVLNKQTNTPNQNEKIKPYKPFVNISNTEFNFPAYNLIGKQLNKNYNALNCPPPNLIIHK